MSFVVACCRGDVWGTDKYCSPVSSKSNSRHDYPCIDHLQACACTASVTSRGLTFAVGEERERRPCCCWGRRAWAEAAADNVRLGHSRMLPLTWLHQCDRCNCEPGDGDRWNDAGSDDKTFLILRHALAPLQFNGCAFVRRVTGCPAEHDISVTRHLVVVGCDDVPEIFLIRELVGGCWLDQADC
ncbi:hypothetical protein NL676_036905 [Syzygium grande]|nr:hypothetical protein NL676_036905 [Syzygium grande]